MTVKRRIVAGFLIDWKPAERQRLAELCPADIEPLFLVGGPAGTDTLGRLDALVVGTDPVSPAVLDGARALKLVQRWGTGFDNVDPAYLRSRGLQSSELPGVNARSVSEFIMLAMLSLLRHLPDVVVGWSHGEWQPGRAGIPHRRLQGKTVGLLGFGAIGQDLARLLEPFEVDILCHDLAPPPGNSRAAHVAKEDMLKRADIVSVQLPLTSATIGAVGAREIALMKSSSVLVSVSRSGVVDEQAVREAVGAGRLAAASFDNFPVEPLPARAMFHQQGILATPHIGGASVEGFEALARACFDNIRRLCATS